MPPLDDLIRLERVRFETVCVEASLKDDNMMIKRFVALLACIGLAGQVTSCTSTESQSDSELSADLDSAELEQIENADSLDIAADDPLMSDALPEDALGESDIAADDSFTTETTTTVTEETTFDSDATTEQTDIVSTDESLPSDPFAESSDSSSDLLADSSSTVEQSVESTPSSYDSSSSFGESSTYSSTETVADAPAEPKKNIPLQKMAENPWTVGGTLYNTLYFARPGDSLDSISHMIYGTDKTSELRKGNPTYKNRDVKPGDKVYYNSPNRPTDDTRVLTYYEDNGMSPEVYVAKSGDNIRSLSQEILGYSNAWKEVWSSNVVDSKGEIPEGTQLRYWRGGQSVAHNELAPAQPSQPPPPPSMAEVPETMPPMDMNTPPMDDSMMAGNDIPPPPSMNDMSDMGMAPPPPMDDFAQDMAPPPPPPVESFNPPAPEQNVAQDVEEGMDNDTTMALGVVSLAAVGLAVLMVVRKKRKQKELEQQALDQTHVGT